MRSSSNWFPNWREGDVIIDGGNSLYTDTQRREKKMSELGFHYLGMGVSGGEEGALKGPSLMPGGSHGAWKSWRPSSKRFPHRSITSPVAATVA